MKRYANIVEIVLLTAILTSCGGQTANVPDVSGNESTADNETSTVAAQITPSIPDDLRYDGQTFTFLIRGGDVSSYMEKYIDAEEENGDPVNDAIYSRNRSVEERLGITIETISPTWSGGWNGELEKLAREYIQSGDSGIDVISSMRTALSSLAQEGYLYNFNDLDYINFNAPYWDANAAEEMTIIGKLFMMPSDISMGNLSLARFTYFNQGIIDKYSLESPYDLIDSNKWTIDKYLGMVKAVSEDLNGDGIFDEKDLYGILTEDNDNGTFAFLLAGTGANLVERDSSKVLIPNILSEKIQTMIEKCSAVFNNTDYAISSEELAKLGDASSYPNKYDYGRALFAEGHFLFYIGYVGSMNQFRDMKEDFGIAPNPKFNETQDDYYHKVDKCALIFGVPVCTGDMERVGAVLEYMASVSHDTLLPEYYETTIKGKRIRDEKAIEMLDLIKSSLMYDISVIYDIGGDKIIWDAYQSGNLASTYDSNKAAFEEKIADLVKNLSDLNQK